MRRNLLIAALVCVLAGIIMRTRAEDVTKNPTTAVPTEPNLDDPLGEIRFDGTPLDKAIERLQKLTRANIIVDWPALDAVGCRRDAPIRLHLFDLPLRKVLDLVLIDACGEQGGRPLGFRVDDRDAQILYVSSREALDRTAVARLYDVRDLMEGFFPTVVGADGKHVATLTPAERVDALVRLLTDNVTPDNWRDNGGTLGHLQVEAGFLFVTQTPENHRSIELVLYNLRRIVASRRAGEKPTTRGIDLLAPPAAETGKR